MLIHNYNNVTELSTFSFSTIHQPKLWDNKKALIHYETHCTAINLTFPKYRVFKTPKDQCDYHEFIISEMKPFVFIQTLTLIPFSVVDSDHYQSFFAFCPAIIANSWVSSSSHWLLFKRVIFLFFILFRAIGYDHMTNQVLIHNYNKHIEHSNLDIPTIHQPKLWGLSKSLIQRRERIVRR